jgi:hypothetical protein
MPACQAPSRPNAPLRRALLGILLGVLAAEGAAAQPAEREGLAAIAQALREATVFLCADCANDIEAEGVNRPMRRVVLAGGGVDRASDLARAAAAHGVPLAVAAMPAIEAARTALDELDEAGALAAIQRALLLLGR